MSRLETHPLSALVRSWSIATDGPLADGAADGRQQPKKQQLGRSADAENCGEDERDERPQRRAQDIWQVTSHKLPPGTNW
jgi:hypothetical protein